MFIFLLISVMVQLLARYATHFWMRLLCHLLLNVCYVNLLRISSEKKCFGGIKSEQRCICRWMFHLHLEWLIPSLCGHHGSPLFPHTHGSCFEKWLLVFGLEFLCIKCLAPSIIGIWHCDYREVLFSRLCEQLANPFFFCLLMQYQ